MNEYYCVCEGCGEEATIYINGFIGVIDDYWCEDCGYDGENMDGNEWITFGEAEDLLLLDDIPESIKEIVINTINVADNSPSDKKMAFRRSLTHLLRKWRS